MKKWYDIYPKGTAEGDIEEKIFKILTRNRKWKFRSVLGISKELKIKEQVIEKMIYNGDIGKLVALRKKNRIVFKNMITK